MKKVLAIAAVCLMVSPAFAQKAVPVKFQSKSAAGSKYTAKVSYPVFTGSDALSVRVNREIQVQVSKHLNDFVKAGKEWQSDPVSRSSAIKYHYDVKPTVSLANDRIISCYLTHEIYTGGAHGNYAVEPFNFGYVNGKPQRLKLNNIFKTQAGIENLSDLVIEDLRKQEASQVMDGTLTKMTPPMAESFVLTRSGISFIITPYMAGSFAEGMFTVKIPYSQLMDLNLNGPIASLLLPVAPAVEKVMGTVTGKAWYREKIMLPDTASLVVRLEDVSLADAKAKVIAEKTYRNAGGGPYNFELKFDTSLINQAHTYAVRATVYVDGKMRFVTDTRHEVLTSGNPDYVEILLVGAGS